MSQFEYDEYSVFSRQLAKTHTFTELKSEIRKLNGERSHLADAHLKAVSDTSGMQSQSQRRAHTRNSMTSNYERLQAYKDAVELYIFYPEKCKEIMNKTASFSRAVVGAYVAAGGSEYDAMEYFIENYT